MWWLYSLLSAMFAALTAVFAKIGIKGVDTDLATAIRTVVILIIAWCIVLSKGSMGALGAMTKQNLLFLFLSGATTGLSWIFYFRALQMGTVAQVAAVDKLSIGIAIILSILFLGETPSPKVLLGVALIIGGTLVLVLN